MATAAFGSEIELGADELRFLQVAQLQLEDLYRPGDSVVSREHRDRQDILLFEFTNALRASLQKGEGYLNAPTRRRLADYLSLYAMTAIEMPPEKRAILIPEYLRQLARIMIDQFTMSLTVPSFSERRRHSTYNVLQVLVQALSLAASDPPTEKQRAIHTLKGSGSVALVNYGGATVAAAGLESRLLTVAFLLALAKPMYSLARNGYTYLRHGKAHSGWTANRLSWRLHYERTVAYMHLFWTFVEAELESKLPGLGDSDQDLQQKRVLETFILKMIGKPSLSHLILAKLSSNLSILQADTNALCQEFLIYAEAESRSQKTKLAEPKSDP